MITLLSFLGAYCLWFLLFSGWGLLLRRAFGVKDLNAEGLFAAFWTGWICVVFLLQIWHLFFPIDSWTLILVAAVGLFGLLENRPALDGLHRFQARRHGLIYLAAVVIVFCVVYRVIRPNEGLYDNSLYYIPSVQWITSFPVVPGLANLHCRFAFNPSYFLYVALMKVWAPGYELLVSSLLLIVLLFQLLSSVLILLRSKDTPLPHHIFNILLLPYAVQSAEYLRAGAPSADFAIFAIGIVLASWFLKTLEGPGGGPDQKPFSFFTLFLLTLGGVVLKINFAVFAAAIAAIAWWSWLKFLKNQPQELKAAYGRKMTMWLAATLILGGLPWLLRNVILTGYPLYPATFGAVPVPWRIPLASVHTLVTQGFRDFALLPIASQTTRQAILQGHPFAWVPTYCNALFYVYFFEVIIPLASTAAALLSLFLIHRRTGSQKERASVVLLAAAALLSLIFWLVSAPAVRFAGASFWILAASTLVLLIERSQNIKKEVFFYLFALFLIEINTTYFGCPYPVFARPKPNFDVWKLINTRDLLQIKTRQGITMRDLKITTTASGLRLYVPRVSDQCWDAPLPCTPYPHPNLRLRDGKHLGSGFLIEPRDEKDAEVGFNPHFN